MAAAGRAARVGGAGIRVVAGGRGRSALAVLAAGVGEAAVATAARRAVRDRGVGAGVSREVTGIGRTRAAVVARLGLADALAGLAGGLDHAGAADARCPRPGGGKQALTGRGVARVERAWVAVVARLGLTAAGTVDALVELGAGVAVVARRGVGDAGAAGLRVAGVVGAGVAVVALGGPTEHR